MEEREISEPLKSVHVRLDPAAHAAAAALASSQQVEISRICEQILEEALLGKFHVLKVTAERLSRLGIVGKARE